MSSCAPIALSLLNRDRTLPPTVDVLANELKSRGIMQKCIFRAQYVWVFQTSIDDIVAGRVDTQTKLVGMLCDKYAESYTADWFKANLANGYRAYALAARVDDYSTVNMPLDIVWTLDTPRVKYRPGQADFMTLFDVARDDAQPFLCPGKTMFFAQQEFDLLAAPLIHMDKHLQGVNFSSIEAIGFDSTALLQNIVTRSANGFYTIPIDYPYLGLIGRVHACLKSAHYHNPPNGSPLLGQTIPQHVFALARTPTYVLIRQSDLDVVIEFINARLLTANSVINPLEVVMTIEPACHTKWNAAYQDFTRINANVSSVKAPAPKKNSSKGAADPSVFTATVYATLFFALIPPGGVFEVTDKIVLPKLSSSSAQPAGVPLGVGVVTPIVEPESRSASTRSMNSQHSTELERREYVGPGNGRGDHKLSFKGSVLGSDTESRDEDFSDKSEDAARSESDMVTGWETQRTMGPAPVAPARPHAAAPVPSLPLAAVAAASSTTPPVASPSALSSLPTLAFENGGGLQDVKSSMSVVNAGED
jgi:hypothetical protein